MMGSKTLSKQTINRVLQDVISWPIGSSSIDLHVPQLSTANAYDRCAHLKGYTREHIGSCGHGWHVNYALAVEKEFPFAFHVVVVVVIL
ncbi:hypothetical protein Tco_1118301 [Tanacetum coccineum]